MSYNPVPKPEKQSDHEKMVARIVKAWGRKRRWQDRAIARAKTKPRTPIKQRNEPRIARKAKEYRRVLASDFHKELRWMARNRTDGYCECDLCVKIRATIEPENHFTLSWGFADQPFADTGWTPGEVERAFTVIPIWFTKRGGEPWRRMRSKDGELHHASYRFFGEENPLELEDARWTWKECHQRIEALHGTRRRFLKGTK